MAYTPAKPSLLLLLSVLLLSFSNSVLGAGHHKHKHAHAHAPAPSLVVTTLPALTPVEAIPALAPIEATPPLVEAPSPVEATPALVEAAPSPSEITPALVEAPSPAFDLAPAEGPSEDDICSTYTSQLLECLDFIEAGTDSTTPGENCCSGLRSMAIGDVTCLCAMLNGNEDSLGFPINASRVMSLPYTCSFVLPTSSKCNALLGPAVATAPVPSGSQGSADITSPPLPAESRAVVLPVAVFAIAAGVVVSMLSLIA